ncbi:hypothetical protein K435DRAFT_665927 [Dendrothele bispora CBS 962.96]|uniref:DDE-1 domain-containing protein n=1 Tax=Dendrothele bispora (strain CBS 962.96) TaxID=1314807 RepID=A0A4S8M220_DENBC|nr:hypothetical protein K435DRAFT_665927 [Dendrothele bispora CBS 962.96]
MKWSPRKSTRAAHKLPDDWEEQCERSFLRKVHAIKQEDMLPEFFVNSDQTQMVYAPGDRMTWAEEGAKQVELEGGDEKHAFTAMVSVAADGTLLPFQAIYAGKTERSCPPRDSPCYKEATEAGMRFDYSGTGTYWSNHETMKSFVNNILAPYFLSAKAKASRPSSQKTIWMIDVWSVHRSQAFRDWMAKFHPTIILDYVPGGCTGVSQPCDVGIQRPFKLSAKKSYHEDIVNEALAQIEDGAKAIVFDNRVGVHRKRSVRWLWNAYNVVNNKELVRKVGFILITSKFSLTELIGLRELQISSMELILGLAHWLSCPVKAS